MSETKHTPGPWFQAPTGEVMQSYAQPFAVGEAGRANLVAGVFGDVAGGIEAAAANARLIAASPDLLEALTGTLALLFCKVRSGWYSADCDCVNCEAITFARAALAKAEPLR